MEVIIKDLEREIVERDSVLNSVEAEKQRQEENAVTVEKEDASTAWTFASVFTVGFFLMVAVSIILCCYIAIQKKKHQATLQFLERDFKQNDIEVAKTGAQRQAVVGSGN